MKGENEKMRRALLSQWSARCDFYRTECEIGHRLAYDCGPFAQENLALGR